MGEQTTNNIHHNTLDDSIKNIVNRLFDSKYTSTAQTLDMALSGLLSSFDENTTKLTIFCPPNEAFSSLAYSPQPPVTLLKYHIAPMKLDREALKSLFSSSTLPIASAKIDTLLPNHPLVVTDVNDKYGYVSINFVKIAKWEMYNDGNVIVHGVQDFFNPAIQTLWYPWYDNDNQIPTSSKSSFKEVYNTIIRMFAGLI